MSLSAWLHFSDQLDSDRRKQISEELYKADVVTNPLTVPSNICGIFAFDVVTQDVLHTLADCFRKCGGKILALATQSPAPASAELWALLTAGASEVLSWPVSVEQVTSRLQRWQAVHQLANCSRVRNLAVGESRCWQQLIAQLVEVAIYSCSSVLVMGESGTGKEVLAHLVHELDPRPRKPELVVVDCTTVTSELSGSEFFGHERGAYTGAVGTRDGAFALANGGTLFLDEIGELPLPLQAQLLRVIQEHKFKRVGSNVWQYTDFRLICATNRDLEAEVARGAFRGDLYYRIAGWVCRTPPLRERREDILSLARHFLEAESSDSIPEFDAAVKEYLLTRPYPGNVRDLRRVVARLHHRHVGPGPITIGDVPEDERPTGSILFESWIDSGFEGALRHAIAMGIGLKEIGKTTTEMAIRLAIDEAGGNLQRAASCLGVTDRALQMRRAESRRPSADLY